MIFDGPSKRIVLESSDGDVIDTIDIYSRWKDWVLEGHAQWPQAMTALGGDPTLPGQYLGRTFFLENDWKIRPREENHEVEITGNLFSRDGTNPLVPPLGTFRVLATVTRSNLVDLLGGGSSPEEIWASARALTVGKFLALKNT